MTMPAPRPRGTRQAFAGREFAIGQVAHPSLLTVAWRWRYECLLGSLVSIGAYLLVATVGGLWATIIVAAMVALVGIVPPLRAEAAAFWWWMVTPHRVRTGMAQAWIHSRDGKIPVIVRTTRQSFGQRVHIWCRAGTSPEDFVWGRHLIASACWAREVRVFRSARYAHFVVLDVIRRGEYSEDDLGPGFWPGADLAESDRRAFGTARQLEWAERAGEGEADHAA
jgi:hypothetical protein